MLNLYGGNIGLPSTSFAIDLDFKVINIFDSIWIDSYGEPYPYDSVIADSSHIKNDVSCVSTNSSERSGLGKISSIKGSVIDIMSPTLGKLTLKVGACTRVQSIKGLPVPGETVYFRGTYSGK